MDNSSQTNTAASEELSVTAEELSAQAKTLQETVSGFKLEARDASQKEDKQNSYSETTSAAETKTVVSLDLSAQDDDEDFIPLRSEVA